MIVSRVAAGVAGLLVVAVPALVLIADQAAGDQSVGEPSGGGSTILTLAIGTMDGELSIHELPGVPDGPPAGEPWWLAVAGIEQQIGVDAGILDREQQVVEVHLLREDGEVFAQLLIEPNIVGHADLDPSIDVVVHFQGMRAGEVDGRSG